MINLDIETAIIVARDLNGIIGRNNRTPWQGELPADMAYFQRVTYGCPVIMGRKTYESLPATLTPLKSRLNVIISRNREYDPRQHSARKDYDPNEVAVVCDFDSALEACLQRNFTRAFVIGGGEIFRLALSHPDERLLEPGDEPTLPDRDGHRSERRLLGNICLARRVVAVEHAAVLQASGVRDADRVAGGYRDGGAGSQEQCQQQHGEDCVSHALGSRASVFNPCGPALGNL